MFNYIYIYIKNICLYVYMYKNILFIYIYILFDIYNGKGDLCLN